MTYSHAPVPKGFPQPHLYATWMARRSPQFKTHASPAHIKSAIGGKVGRNATIDGDIYIYSWDEGTAEWVELDFLPHGSLKTDSKFYQASTKKAVRQAKPPSEKAVAEAIASLRRSNDPGPRAHADCMPGEPCLSGRGECPYESKEP